MSANPTGNTPGSEDGPLLSADQMAAKLGISGRCVLNWYYDKIIPAAVHQGKVIRFRESDVMAALDAARKERETTKDQAIPEDVLRLALWLLAPDEAEPPGWMLDREPTREEEVAASRFAVAYSKVMSSLKTSKQRWIFVHDELKGPITFQFKRRFNGEGDENRA